MIIYCCASFKGFDPEEFFGVAGICLMSFLIGESFTTPYHSAKVPRPPL